ncbi:MAG: choice-of-anchor B family protein [Gemmatimonadota bacterium]|nr:choice-of-anchor B family protein [Gemmatimonadota bacterium]MDE2983849.1 choice-of-anchor B family protein [Gemmatimonadota bacterium]
MNQRPRITGLPECAVAVTALVAACGDPDARGVIEPPPDTTTTAVPSGFKACTGGMAGDFSCSGIDLMSRLTRAEMGNTEGNASDLWGWTDPETGIEWALVGHSQGTAFISLQDPARPVYAGILPLTEGAHPSLWRDIKVYGNHAFIVADGAGQHGMQVLDLTQLRSVSSPPATFSPTTTYHRIHSAHNIAINTETGFAYSVGGSGGEDTCGGGLHMIDIRTPSNPEFAGCFADESTGNRRTGYTHDAICIVYRGPDTDHRDREICFGSNETALSIADVTDKSNPAALASVSYPDIGYTHQGWLDEAHEYLYVNDEFDEFNLGKTRTLVWDVKDLDDPIVASEFEHNTAVSDHNLYVVGNLMYQSNYAAGLRILTISDRENPREIAFFDTEPGAADEPGFWGSWSNYPFFASGVIPVTSMGGGVLFVKSTN